MIDLQRVPGGYRIKTEGGYHLDVRPMMRLFRLAEVPESEPRDTARYWCYTSFEAAVLAGSIWPISADTEPVGFVREGGARQA